MRQTADGKYKPCEDVNSRSRQRHESVSSRRLCWCPSNKRPEHVHTYLLDLGPHHVGCEYVTDLMDHNVQDGPEKEDSKSGQYLADLISRDMPETEEKQDHPYSLYRLPIFVGNQR